MDFTKEPQRVLSMCTGIRGLERGLERAGVTIQPVVYLEIEAVLCANLVAAMEAGVLAPAPIFTDITKFDARPFRGRVHGIIGGYPCPGESIAGLREGHLYKGFIWPAIRKAIAAARPLWCFFENVDDHITGTYPIVKRGLRNLGYRVEEGIFSAEEVGSTCERQRLFILAVADSYCNGYRTGTGQTIGKGSEVEKETQRKERHDVFRQWLRDVVRNSGEKMGNPNNEPINKSGGGLRREFKSAGKEVDSANGTRLTPGSKLQSGPGQGIQKPVSGSEKVYPMPQGYEQYEWEPPRIESRMVYNTLGYNFREDLVRAIGNMVDENTAELAFKTLLKKHLA